MLGRPWIQLQSSRTEEREKWEVKEYCCMSWSANNIPSGFCKHGHGETMEEEHSMGRKKGMLGFQTSRLLTLPGGRGEQKQ